MTIRDIAVLFGSISELSGLLPSIAFLIYYRLTTERQPHLLVAVLANTVLDIASLITFKLGIHNHYIYHLIGLSELVFLSLFYHHNGHFNKTLKYIFYVFVLAYILNSLTLESILQTDKMNAFGRSLAGIFLVFLSLRFFYIIYNRELTLDLSKYSLFWVNSGLLIYQCLSLFVFLLSNQILRLPIMDFFSAAWILVLIGHMVKNICIYIGIRLIRHE